MSTLKKILKQYKIPWVGGFKETLAQAAFWLTVINFNLIAITAYNTTLSEPTSNFYLPWLNFPVFIGTLVFLVFIGMVIEYKFIVPSLYMFRSRQMFEHESTITRKLDKILKELKKKDEKPNNN